MKNKALSRSVLLKIVFAAVLAALTCVATMVVTIPSPMGGFLNLGDGFVLLSGWLLGPAYGFAAAGLGSALADLLLSYAYYVPGTFVIKGLSALIFAFLAPALVRLMKKHEFSAHLAASATAELWMVAGYFLYAATVRGKGLAAAASIPGNLAQGAAGVILFLLFSAVLKKTGIREKFFAAPDGRR